jgi:hypothetical protein
MSVCYKIFDLFRKPLAAGVILIPQSNQPVIFENSNNFVDQFTVIMGITDKDTVVFHSIPPKIRVKYLDIVLEYARCFCNGNVVGRMGIS